MMKKSRPKLPLRTETLRALYRMHLGHAVGGREADASLLGVITREDGCAVALKV